MTSRIRHPSSSEAGLRRLRWVSAILLGSVLSMGTSGCAKSPQKPPEAPLKQAKKDSRLDEQEQPDVERRHLAPPPAYGNKVVMAADERTTTSEF